MVLLRGHHLRVLYGYLRAKEYGERSLDRKKSAIVTAAINDGHSSAHAKNVLSILENASDSDEKITLTDTIDDICKTCDRKDTRVCKDFIPYDMSASCEDRAEMRWYGLQKRTYTAKLIHKRLYDKGLM